MTFKEFVALDTSEPDDHFELSIFRRQRGDDLKVLCKKFKPEVKIESTEASITVGHPYPRCLYEDKGLLVTGNVSDESTMGFLIYDVKTGALKFRDENLAPPDLEFKADSIIFMSVNSGKEVPGEKCIAELHNEGWGCREVEKVSLDLKTFKIQKLGYKKLMDSRTKGYKSPYVNNG